MGIAKNGVIKFFERNRNTFIYYALYCVLFFRHCGLSWIHVVVLAVVYSHHHYLAYISNTNKKISLHFSTKPCFKKISQENFCNAIAHLWRHYRYNDWANCGWNDHCEFVRTYSHSHLQPCIVHRKSYSNSSAKHSIYFDRRARSLVERQKFSGDTTHLSTFIYQYVVTVVIYFWKRVAQHFRRLTVISCAK